MGLGVIKRFFKNDYTVAALFFIFGQYLTFRNTNLISLFSEAGFQEGSLNFAIILKDSVHTYYLIIIALLLVLVKKLDSRVKELLSKLKVKI